MPRAFGFDGDSAYYEALEAHVRAQEAQRRASEAAAEKERRTSLGLPAEEGKRSRSARRAEKNADPARKKSIGEKVSNFVFNAGRSSKTQRWGEERVGLGDGEIKRVGEGEREEGNKGERHGEARVVR